MIQGPFPSQKAAAGLGRRIAELMVKQGIMEIKEHERKLQ